MLPTDTFLTAASALLLGLPPAGLNADEGLAVGATLDAEELEVGGKYEITVALDLDEGVSTGDAGLPAPFLQLDVPPSVRLTERALTEHRELARNGFLQAPHERLMEEELTTIPFELVAEPGEDETIGLVITSFVKRRAEDGTAVETFFRKRLELPVAPGARTRDGDSSDSSWGTDAELLQIGDRAASFELPLLAGDTALSLDTYLGEKNLIVTTYRAHW